jgi:ribose-phosphate pyrophosphokinase
VVAPDAGGVERARFFAKKLDTPLAIVDKRRVDIDVSEVIHLIGDIKGRDALIIDDIIDTGGTLVKTVDMLMNKGARRVFACCTHPVLSGSAVQRIASSAMEELVVTNSIPLAPQAQACSKIKVLSVGELLASAIQSIHEETSVSTLFI